MKELSVIKRAVDDALAELPDFPCAMTEMTERELQIAAIANQLTGTLKFISEYIDKEK